MLHLETLHCLWLKEGQQWENHCLQCSLETDLPLPAFLGGRGGASDVGEVGESVLTEAKIWLVKAP